MLNMNHNKKRYRQTSLFESFALSKKPKADIDTNMEENADNKENSVATEEENVFLHSELQEFANVCKAAEDSAMIQNENNEAVAGPSSVLETGAVEHMETENSFKYSDDLFPNDPSLEDSSVPSSSQSADLFPDSGHQSENESSPDSEEIDPMTMLNRKPDCCLPLPKLEPSARHFIMFSPHIRPGDAPRPYPYSSYRDKWDTDHVRMPCSPLNRYPVANSIGEKRIESRWDLICRSLRRDIGSSKELEAAIMKYNSQYIGKWNFGGLHAFINEHLNEAERILFFEDILPAMVEMALNLPNICTQPVPLMKSGKDHYITMSQKQIGCLLLNAFFCTFPRRSGPNRSSKHRSEFEYASYPDINFNRLFFGVKNRISQRNAEKLKCLFNYFRRITSAEPSGTVTFHRQCITSDKMPSWNSSTRGVRIAVIKSSGLIETDGRGMLQVDFANKFVGGGVLGQGCVQEEIRFVICPELLVTRLFVERLENNEALIVTGVEQYNKYSGYADTFKWEGDFRDETPRDSWGRRYTEVLAIDATHFTNPAEQFKFSFLKRELNKAYSGFYEDSPPVNLSAVATGNWGCGAFRGNPKLKFLIQLMAASEAQRSLVYFTFGNKKLRTEIQEIYQFLSDKNLSVGDIWRLLMSCSRNESLCNDKDPQIYDFIYSQFVIKESRSEIVENGSSKDQILDDSDKNAMNKLFEEIAFGSSTEIEDGT